MFRVKSFILYAGHVNNHASNRILPIHYRQDKTESSTYSGRCCKVLYTNQVSLQLCKFLEILQPDETALELSGYVSYFLQSLCNHKTRFVTLHLHSYSLSNKFNTTISETLVHKIELTLAVIVISVYGRIMFAQSLQNELVVHEALDGLKQECVEGQVADLLQFKLFVNSLQFFQPLSSLLQLC